ncbi:hypothetical protein APY04_1561 [Hyphomicrobium sulfonivorans]|uniref:Uncharacterized protein n=1 Tax=Hyphomicrobium sulfonivorans TaxID=121290 RepID=A0A125NVD8_HYPSL|nr:hypothetical protein APY04_1561 [Hyphomicrobium sulfonivorans]
MLDCHVSADANPGIAMQRQLLNAAFEMQRRMNFASQQCDLERRTSE